MADEYMNGNANSSNESRSSAGALSKKTEREMKKQREKEQKRLEKLRAKQGILQETAEEEAAAEEAYNEEPFDEQTAEPERVAQSAEAQTNENGEAESQNEENKPAANVEKIDLSELKKVQEEIKKENGETDVVIDTHYKVQKDDEDAPVQTTAKPSAVDDFAAFADFMDSRYADEAEDANEKPAEEAPKEEAKPEPEKPAEPEQTQEKNEPESEAPAESSAEAQEQPQEQPAEPQVSAPEQPKEEAEEEEHETLTQDDSIGVTEEDKNYREKEEINKRLQESDSIARVDADEIAKIKRELALERGEVFEEEQKPAPAKNANINQNAEKTAPKPANEAKKPEEPAEEPATHEEEKPLEEEAKTESSEPEPKAEESEKGESEEQLEEEFNENLVTLIDDGFYDSEEKESSKNASSKDPNETAPPDVSQQDNITDEDIEKLLKEQEEEAKKQLEEEDEKEYEGLSEEEVAEAKKRKQKFRELKQRYNAKETSTDGEIGDYRKNLDFSINTSIKRFKVKPPKKPFIIAASVISVMLIVAGLITYLVLNQPAPPTTLVKIELSLPCTSQYVGEDVDLRGIYITKYFNDETTETVQATTDMISAKTPNISANFNITEFRRETFVEFKIETAEAVRLEIKLFQMLVTDLHVELFQTEIVSGQELKFENMLLTATIAYGRDNQPMDELGTSTIKLDIDPSKLTAFIGQEQLVVTETGIVIPEGVSSIQFIRIKYQGSNKYVISENKEAELRVEIAANE